MILGVLLVASLGLLGLTAAGQLGTDGITRAEASDSFQATAATAPAAAEAAAVIILAYDHRSLGAELETAVRFMTTDFAQDYSSTFTSELAPVAERNRVRVGVVVADSALLSASDDTAQVLLFVDQATTTAERRRPEFVSAPVEMDLVRDGDRWLVDNLTSY